MSWLPKKRETGEALSDFWGSRFGGFNDWWKDDKADSLKKRAGDAMKYVQPVQSIKKIADIVFDGKMSASWKRTGRDILLDAEPLDTKDVNWSSGKRVDALTGAALQEGARRQFVRDGLDFREKLEAAVHTEFKSQNLARLIGGIHEATEYLYATRRLADSFPGYVGYLGTDREFRHRKQTREQWEGTLQADVMSGNLLGAAAKALVWNTVNPEEPLATGSSDVDDAVTELQQYISESVDKIPFKGVRRGSDVSEVANSVYQELRRRLPPPPEEEESGGGGGGSGDASEMLGQIGMDTSDAHKTMLDNETQKEVSDLVERDVEKDSTGIGAVGDYDGRKVPIVSILAKTSNPSYNRVRQKVFSLIRRTRDVLKFRNEQKGESEFGRKYGLLDEGGIHKLLWADDRVFRRYEVESLPDVHVGLLLDQSGSMNGTGVETAKDVAILMREALRGYRGVHLSIWGHTSDTSLNREGPVLFRYIEHDTGDPGRLGTVSAHSGNMDGFAVAWCVEKMLKLSRPEETKLLFVLCDGNPAGGGYYGFQANRHTQLCASLGRQKGVQVYALGMGVGINPNTLEYLYGKGNWQHCARPEDLPKAVSKLLAKALKFGKV